MLPANHRPMPKLPNSGYSRMDMKKPYITKADSRQRSAMAPVGIVAAVSMNTIWNKNMVSTPTS